MSSSDDGFDPSPLPTKRRRLNSHASTGAEADGHSSGHQKVNRKPAQKSGAKISKSAKKPKHLVHVHTKVEDVEDHFLTQLPDIPSSPWRIRGARWKKSESTGPLRDKSPNLPISAVEQTLSPACRGSDSSLDQELSPSAQHNSAGRSNVSPQSSAAPKENGIIGAAPRLAPPALTFNIDQELADLPSDAFASSSSSPRKPTSPSQTNVVVLSSQPTRPLQQRQNLTAPQRGLQQMTLFGQTAGQGERASQSNKVHNWPLMQRDEPPTHHGMDNEALKTWVYPTNLGTIRDYQFNIVNMGLYHNLLVALPTGLGKTFIAATIMLNWYRWTKDAQIVFVAPTKPLVAQQVEACYRIAGIPRSQTTMLTGTVPAGLRAEEWTEKRVFFMTPQTLINDLKGGYCDPKKIVLLVVDEAHRATGSYAYVEVVKFIRRFNESFRVLALTATPGNSVESVQEVIDGLDISRVEIRTEISLDIREYVHSRNTEQVVFDYSEELELIMSLFSSALQPVLNKLKQFNAYWSADPMQLSAYGLTKRRQSWFASAGRTESAGVKGMVQRLFTVLASLAHSIEVLKFHGIGPFYHKMVAFKNSIEVTKGNKYEKEIADSDHFTKMMNTLTFWCSNPEFVGHPKLEYLQSVVLKHFSDASEGHGPDNGEAPSSTRVMIFVHFRDSAEEVVRVLKRSEPMVRPHVFVGQVASNGSEGMDQKRQLEVVEQFKSGRYNTLVATSIGEEGLDIGEIDLIICYDSSASPIRMLQRMGRTGRKRAGNIVLLLMREKEEKAFVAAKDNYEKMQKMIADAKRFSFHDDRSRRIVPKHIDPTVDRRVVEIPAENREASFYPEPKKRGRVPKKPAKKFHMPDGVRTGFVKASRMNDGESSSDEGNEVSRAHMAASERLETIPPINEILLTAEQDSHLTKYQHIPTTDETDVFIGMPSLQSYPDHQSSLAPIKKVQHGHATRSAVTAFKAMRNIDGNRLEVFKRLSQEIDTTQLRDNRVISSPVKQITTTKRKRPQLSKAQQPRLGRASKSSRKSMMTGDKDALEAISSSPPPTDPLLLLPSQAVDLGSDDTSGEEEPDGEPSSELRDFVVEDGDEEDDNMDGTTLKSSFEASAVFRSRIAVGSTLLEMSQTTVQNSSDDEPLPSLNTLLNTRAEDSDGVTEKPSKGAKDTRRKAKRKRMVIDDSSD